MNRESPVEPIRFGTSGWREILGEGFTVPRVLAIAQAYGEILKSRRRSGSALRILVGFDTRFLSDSCAAAAANVLAREGLDVALEREATPTPVLNFRVVRAGYDGGLVLTASHNPPLYHGIKILHHAGILADRAFTDLLQRRAAAILHGSEPPKGSLQEGLDGRIRLQDSFAEYLLQLGKLVPPLLPRAEEATGQALILADPLHGAAGRYLVPLLEQYGVRAEGLHLSPDPRFGGLQPDPTDQNLAELSLEVKRRGALLGLATDGDGDRFGVVDRDGGYVSPNRVLPLLVRHLMETRGLRGVVVRTVSTTHLIDAVAERFGGRVVETPVGFKDVGRAILEHNAVCGCEESGGFAFGPHLPDKDGLLAGLLILEMVLASGRSLGELWEETVREFGEFHGDRLDLPIRDPLRQQVVRRLWNQPPRQLAGGKVTEVRTIDGIKFVREDGSWLMVRAAGTEPLVRCYLEARSVHDLDRLRREARQIVEEQLSETERAAALRS